ncbi:MAG: hypothetical protein NVS1B11_29020 [Terriglobales bacterium]
MAISVAPLTTVVMNSVENNHTGTASGINNAVARVAGVLAIAILGVVMVGTFSRQLLASLGTLNPSPDVLQTIRSNLVQLGALKVPLGLDASTTAAIQAAVTQSFLFGFRLVMVTCALLAICSAFIALTMIPPKDAYGAGVKVVV